MGNYNFRFTFPLEWPVGYPRTVASKRIDSKFKQTMENAQIHLHNELHRINAKQPSINTNAPARGDGGLYADAMKRKSTEDPGVAVYFTYKDKHTVLCCDQYRTIWENIYAIAKTVENLRAIDRYGVSDFLNRTMTGFNELPPSFEMGSSRTPEEVFNIGEDEKQDFSGLQLSERYKRLAKERHPDTSGTTQAFQELNWAYEQLKKKYGHD